MYNTTSNDQFVSRPRRPIPRDEETVRKASKVIDAQFDLEILLRHREMQKIQDELKKAKRVLETLKHCILEPPPDRLQDSICKISTSNNQSNSSLPSTRHSTRKIYSTRDNDYYYFDPCRDLYSRRNDGTYVKLACPECHRSKFINVQGFLNHCRLSHKIEFPNHEEALLICGTPVNESIIPLDHPARSRIVTRPPSLRTILGQSNPTIKVFEEDIDLGVDEHSIRHDKTYSNNQESGYSENSPISYTTSDRAIKSSENDTNLDSPDVLGLNYTSSEIDDCELSSNSSDLDFSPFNKTTPPYYQHKIKSETNIVDTNDKISPENNIEDSHSKENDSSNDVIGKSENEIMEIDSTTINNEIQKSQHDGSKLINNSKSDVVKATTSVSTNIDQTNLSGISQQREVTTISAAFTIPACISVFDPIDHGSRFYVKRRIVVGNVSKWVAPEKRDPNLQKYTHKWMVYVAGPPHDLNVTPFIRKVRFYLHPSYRPHDIVDVVDSPFQLTRYGWGEFPIRIQIFFVDKRNKPVDVIHALKLDDTHSGKQRLGDERAFDLELDRNTEFIASIPEHNKQKRKLNIIQDSIQQNVSNVKQMSVNIIPTQKKKEQNNEGLTLEDINCIEPLLNEAVQNYPLILSLSAHAARKSTLPYSTATSARVYLSWDLDRRKASEINRAKLIRSLVQSLARTSIDEKVKSIAESLTTRQVVLWCRKNGYTPVNLEGASNSDALNRNITIKPYISSLVSNDLDTSTSLIKRPQHQITYCKSCGCPEVWHEINSSTTKSSNGIVFSYKCRLRPHILQTKKRRLVSLTSAKEFLEELEDNDNYQGDDAMNIDIGGGIIFNIKDIGTMKSGNKSKHWYATTNIPDPRGIDWIWSVVGNLQLEGVVATKLITNENGIISFEEGDQNIAMQQRLETGNLLLQLTRVFLKDLINKSMRTYKSEILDDPGPSRSVNAKKLLIPYHIYQTIQSHLDTFDFLTGEGLASDKVK
ncbi:14430_t:CDS:2 [Funneliformis geosporum]|uniref:4476_t:CDS:1 n=1 Tax=Funneliformis geosporum TaxID=1117311 RepID=A0A9W4SZX9_9GLOM|nr:4476_t:CDS:2 [Funneliformis geosporum]CAI2188584.1 14430_t:CDS:2 [Funneliformis geosporum]